MAVLTDDETIPARHSYRTERPPTVLLSVRRCVSTLLTVVLALPVLRLHAQTLASTDEVKAAYLLNFAKFVDWPEPQRGAETMVLGVMASDGLADALSLTVKDKMIAGRKLVVRRVTLSDQLTGLHVLYVGAAPEAQVAEILRRVDAKGVLTVSDIEPFCRIGGAIGLVLENNRLRFEINLEPAERSSLKVSSKLLTLARKVYPAKTAAERRVP